MTYILGISSFYHDSAAALIKDAEIIAAAQEERFTRIKHDSSFPINSIKFVLNYANITLLDVDKVIFYEKPLLKFQRIISTHIKNAPESFNQYLASISGWLESKLFQKKNLINFLKKIDKNFDKGKIFFSEHHLSHAASAFYPSKFKNAIILTADGVGEWSTTSVAIGNDTKIEIQKEINFPDSLGLLYSAFTYFTGFKVNSGEYKLMGLAPYGDPIYADKIKKNLIDIKDDGSFKLDEEYFNYTKGFTMTNSKFDNLFFSKPRKKSDKLNKLHMDIAASVQQVTEEIMIRICKSLKKEYNLDNLALAGGVALNCVANGKILEEKIFNNIWVQPASGDAGCSIGAALVGYYQDKNNKRIINENYGMKGTFLGPKFSNEEIKKILIHLNANFEYFSDENIIDLTCEALSSGKAVGWYQGRMEFGPRALGARSILCDPRSENVKKNLNLKIKFRESFRPFAPSILEEHANEWFNIKCESPYMMFVSKINEKKRIYTNHENLNKSKYDLKYVKNSEVPAITHVDYSARVHTVNKNENPFFYKLIKKFNEKNNCPILVNTSFNVRGEPIVNTPGDAYNCFMGTNLDILVLGNYFLKKQNQKKKLDTNYMAKFELD